MAEYRFKPQFVAPIQARTKQQTIRAPRKDGWVPRPGILLQLATGPRMRPTRIGLARCWNVGAVFLKFSAGWVRFEGTYGQAHGVTTLDTQEDLDRFAVRDGFTDWQDMAAFWAKVHQTDRFLGVRILWGDSFAGPLDPPPALLPEELPQEKTT